MLNITQTGIGDEIDYRNRDVVNVKGVKVMANYRSTGNNVVMLHYALVTWKNNANALSTDEFFRAFDNTRGVDFDATLYGNMVFNQYPLNSDRMHIHFHKRQLIGQTTSAGMPNTNHIRFFKRYHKFYRQVRYDSEDNPTNTNLYLIYWTDGIASAVGTTPSAQGIATVEAITYFGDPKA